MSALPTGTIDVVNDPDRAAVMLHPLRLRLLGGLSEPDSASGLARKMRLPRQKVNYHLRELEAAGLVEQVEERRKGNCTERIVRATATSYLVDPAALGDIAAEPSRVRDRLSAAYLIASFAKAIRDLATLRRRADAAKKPLPTFTLETEVRFASAESQHAFTESVSNAVARLVAEHHDADAPKGRAFTFLIGAFPTMTKTDAEAAAEQARAGTEDA